MTNETAVAAILAHCAGRYREEEYPALAAQRAEWARTRPLDGLRILDATPLFTNTLLKYVPLLAAGAELTVAVHDAIPRDNALPPLIGEWGIRVVRNATEGEYDCVLDCDGAHSSIAAALGAAELTRSGFYHYEHSARPVIMVDDSRIKTIETCLGTGDGFLRGMRQMGFADFSGRKIVLFGYGKVGRGIAYYAAREGAIVTVVDESAAEVPRPLAFVSRFDREAVRRAVREAWCVVTATGRRGAMRGNGAAEEILRGGQIVAAMGIEDEWCEELPKERVLCEGKALNFILEEPTQLRFIDPTMALSNAAAAELAKRTYPPGVSRIDPAVEERYLSLVSEKIRAACAAVLPSIGSEFVKP